MSPFPSRLIAGCMTGTSLDGLDVSLVEVIGKGLDMTARCLGHVSRALGPLATVLGSMAEGRTHEPLAYMRAARQLGELHADAVDDVCRRFMPGARRLDMVTAHGQTIWHAPEQGLSWQLFDPEPVVRRLNVPVCYDLRQADLIAGGQGAPITPISDWVMFRHPRQSRLIVNLGGVCNMAYLPAGGRPQTIQGADIGPCNLLIDGVVQRLCPDRRMDTDGRIASKGRIDSEVLDLIMQDQPDTHQPHPRSLGREDYSSDWISRLLHAMPDNLSPADIVASVVDAVARMIGRSAFAGLTDQVVLAGGGAKHPVLVDRVRRAMPDHQVMLSDDLGIPVSTRESAGFAVLGALCQDRIPISLPQVTGSQAPGVAGRWVLPGGAV